MHIDSRFIKQKTIWDVDQPPADPSETLFIPSNFPGEHYKSRNVKGQVCPACGMCVQRLHWEGWVCQNKGCDWELIPEPCLFPHQMITHDLPLSYNLPPVSSDWHAEAITSTSRFENGIKWINFCIEGLPDCSITHGIVNKSIHDAPFGANIIFDALQDHGLSMERRRVSMGACELCTSMRRTHDIDEKQVATIPNPSHEILVKAMLGSRPVKALRLKMLPGSYKLVLSY